MKANIFKSAMSCGLVMGVIFTINFLFSVSGNTFLEYLSWLVVAVIVIVTFKFAIRFRTNECAGVISFGKAFSFIVLLFFYAAIISAAVKFIYFQWLNTTYLQTLVTEIVKMLQQMQFPAESIAIAKQTAKILYSPINFTLTSIFANVFYGVISGVILAAFVKKDEDIFTKLNV